jgi:hypothetical protein
MRRNESGITIEVVQSFCSIREPLVEKSLERHYGSYRKRAMLTPEQPTRICATKGERVAAVLAIGLCAAVLIRRLISVSVAAGIPPGVACTTGCEEASFNALWDVIHGAPLYPDPRRIPFASSYFNWLFYVGYAALIRPFVAGYTGQSIVVVGRLVTLSAAVVGSMFLVRTAVQRLGATWTTASLCAATLFFGPLVGWWILTVRPDLWALALAAAGAYVLIARGDRLGFLPVLPAALFFFLAWSMKPSVVLSFASVIVWLLLRREFRAAALLGGVFAALCASAMAFLGPAFRFSMVHMAEGSTYDVGSGISNLKDAVVKALPLEVLALPGLWLVVRRARAQSGAVPWACLTLGSVGIAITVPMSAVTSCKDGAWSNYFFESALMATLVAIGGCSAGIRVFPKFAIAAAFLLAAGQALVVTGRVGVIDLEPSARELAQRWQAWKDEPQPRFSADLRLNLPWISPGSEGFVLAYNYARDRERGIPFENGGIRGLISKGYFKALMLQGDLTSFDGADLSGYRVVDRSMGMGILELTHKAAH